MSRRCSRGRKKEDKPVNAGRTQRHPEARGGLTVCVGVGHLLVCHHSRCGVVHLSEATNHSQSRAPDLRTCSKKNSNKQTKTSKQKQANKRQASSQPRRLQQSGVKINHSKERNKKRGTEKPGSLTPPSLGSSSDESSDTFQASE